MSKIFFMQMGIQDDPIVVACRKRLDEIKGDNEIVYINEFQDFYNNVDWRFRVDLVDLKLSGPSLTAISDYMRCALLACNGGIWCDATCYISNPDILYRNRFEWYHKDAKYRKNGILLPVSWYINAGNSDEAKLYFSSCARKAFRYLTSHTDVPDYYYIYKIFQDTLIERPEVLKHMVCRYNVPSFQLWAVRDLPPNQYLTDLLFKGASVHKLDRKESYVTDKPTILNTLCPTLYNPLSPTSGIAQSSANSHELINIQ